MWMEVSIAWLKHVIKLLRPSYPDRDNACPWSGYRLLEHVFCVVGFSCLIGLFALLVVVVGAVPGEDFSLVLLLQFVSQCEEACEGWISKQRLSAFGPESHAFCTSLEPIDLDCAWILASSPRFHVQDDVLNFFSIRPLFS